MFYVVLGYLVSYLLCAVPARALALVSGIVPWADQPVGGAVLLPAAMLGQLLVMPIIIEILEGWRSTVGGRLLTNSEFSSPAVTSRCEQGLLAAQIQRAEQKWMSERFL